MTLIANFNIDALPLAGAPRRPGLSIESEKPADYLARERLLDEAFGAARFDETVERLREGRLPARGFALVAKEGEDLVGTVRMWHILAGEVPALLLGPLAVAKPRRSRGIGRGLMTQALFRAARAGHAAILLVGDPPYYEPLGFSRRHTLGLSLRGPVEEARFLGLELKEGALRGARGLVTAAGAPELRGDDGANDWRPAA
jgi:predicted N-acetyltransferase YhbS